MIFRDEYYLGKLKNVFLFINDFQSSILQKRAGAFGFDKKKNQKKNIGMLRIQELSSVDGWLAS